MINEGFDGFLTPPSATALAEKSLSILQNEELRQRLGNQAKESAKQINATATAARMAKAYQALLK